MKNLFGLLLLGSTILLGCGGGGSSEEPTPPPVSVNVKAEFTFSCDTQGLCSFDGNGSSGSIINFDWEFGDGSTGTGRTVNHRFTNEQSYTVKLTVKNTSNTDSIQKAVEVDFNEAPQAAYTFNCNLLACDYDASTSQDDAGGLSFEWFFGDGATSTDVSGQHSYDTEGTYTVSLIVTDAEGLTDEIEFAVSVDAPTALEAYKAQIKDMFGHLLFVGDFAQTEYIYNEKMTELVNANGMIDPADDTEFLEGNCGLTGTYRINGWNDGNGNGVYDANDVIYTESVNCQYEVNTLPINMSKGSFLDTLGVAGMYDVSIGNINSLTINESLMVGLFDPADPYTTIATSSTALNYKDSNGSVTDNGFIKVALRAHNIALPLGELWGEFELSGAHHKHQIHTLKVDGNGNNVFIEKVNDEYRLRTGFIESKHYETFGDSDSFTHAIRLSADSDPAYIRVELDSDNDGVYEAQDRFLQSEVLVHFN